MTGLIAHSIVAFYGLLLACLFIYGLNILYMAHRARRIPQQTPPHRLPVTLPVVTVQLPIYNERYVAARVIDAVCALDWPRDRLQIQVLDDSTDDTRQIIAARVAHWRAKGLDIVHQQRDTRTGYKAGALGAALPDARGAFIAIFDADFVPPPDFLRRALPHFTDQRVAFVQTRWGHLNAETSHFTRVQSLAIDAHFAVEQSVRQHHGFLMNFNGTGGVWRKAAIKAAGGWHADTLTEDLDLSYRAYLAGWRGAFVRDVVVPGEIPDTLASFRRQQHRWARGSIMCARKLLPTVMRSTFSPWVKLQATLHLTGYGIQLLMSAVVLLYLPLMLAAPQAITLQPYFELTAIFTLAFFAPTYYLLTGQHVLGQRPRLGHIVLLSLLGGGLMFHNAYAVLAGLRSDAQAHFERTPKRGDTTSPSHYMLPRGKMYLFEAGMVVYNLVSFAMALVTENYSIAFFTAYFTLGLLYILGLGSVQALGNFRLRRRAVAQRQNALH